MASVLSRGRIVWPSARLWLFLGAAFALWLNANPYIGIDHDARLYAVMAYRWLNPQPFAHDPWFLFGSQDDYSLFSPLLAGVFSLLGVSGGAIAGTALQGMFFSVAVVTLARQGFGPLRYGKAALLMVAFPVLYSPWGMLHVTEGFVTARGIAVPLSLLGLSMSLCRRRSWAAGFHGFALLLHPIMALTPAAVSVLYPLSWRRRTALIVVAVAAYVVLLMAAISGHLPLIDGNWRRYLQKAPLIFVDDWVEGEAPWLLLWTAVLLLASRYGTPCMRGMYALIPVVSWVAIGFSLLAAVVPWTLAMQVQFWRAIWLLKLFGLCAVADLLGGFLRVRASPKNLRRGEQLLAAGAFWASFSHPFLSLGVIGLLWLRRPRLTLSLWLKEHSNVFYGFLILFLILGAQELMFTMTTRVKDFAVVGYWQEVVHGFWRTSALGICAIGLSMLLERWSRMKAAVLVVVLMAGALSCWDVRSMERVRQENCYAVAGKAGCLPFQIPPGATVYWQDKTERIWLELGASSYAGGIHAIGLVFSQQRAALIQERLARVVVATLADEGLPAWRDLATIQRRALSVLSRPSFVHPDLPGTYEAAGNLTLKGARWLCQDEALDFVVLDAKATGSASPRLVSCKAERQS